MQANENSPSARPGRGFTWSLVVVLYGVEKRFWLGNVEELLHVLDSLPREGAVVASVKLGFVEPDVSQGFAERDLRQRAAVAIVGTAVLEEAPVRRHHQVAFRHRVIVLDGDVEDSIQIVEVHVVVVDEGIEHKVRYPPVVAERHLAQDLPFAGLELEYIIQQVLAVVVLVDDRIDLNHERGIFVADKRYLFFQVFEEEHPAVTGAPDLDVGIGIEGIDGDTDLRNHVRERADDFEVAAVGDHRDLRTVFLCDLHDVPELFWLQDGFAADDVQAEALGNHGGGLDVVGDTRDDVFDLVRVGPYFALLAPLGKAVLAAVVAGFGDVPVDAHGDGSFGVGGHK